MPEKMIKNILTEAVRQNASDVHIKAGAVPVLRIDGVLHKLFLPAVSEEEITSFVKHNGDSGIESAEMDFAYGDEGTERFRVHVYLQSGLPALAVRLIKNTVPSLHDLNAPPLLKKLALQRSGLVLVTGATGSGKSTTLAAMLETVNQNRSAHIITLEDPVEYRFTEAKSIISQRCIGIDTPDFSSGLRAALREDPDVIMVGELRDMQTIAVAVTAAETGHLVLATLHTRSVISALARMADFFPPEKQQQIRSQLADNLQGVVAQQLVPACSGGRTAAFEVLAAVPAVRNLIRDDKAYQLANYLQSGRQQGMQCMDYALAELVKNNKITRQTAEAYAFDLELLYKYLLLK